MGRPGGGQRSWVRPCEISGCGQPPKNGKPFCTEHIFHNEYALWVEIEWEKRLATRRRLQGFKDNEITIDCHYLKEVLAYIAVYGPTSIEYLGQQFSLDFVAMERVCDYLYRYDEIIYTEKRKKLIVELPI